MTPEMKLILDGSRIRGVDDFIHALRDALQSPYFGFELHSLRDCLFGGYAPQPPPYHVLVTDARPMQAAMDHAGKAAYCRAMLAIIDNGGRGLVQRDSLQFFRQALAEANNRTGPTLLDDLLETFRDPPGSLTLRDDFGQTLATTLE